MNLQEKIQMIVGSFSAEKLDNNNSPWTEWCVDMEHSGITTRFGGVNELRDYMLGWHMHDNFKRFPIPVDQDVVASSARFHSNIFAFYYPDAESNLFATSGFGDQVNAQNSYFLFDAYRRFAEPDKLKVLDFGAGYCRTLNFLSRTERLVEYCAVDGNENSYLSQFLYLHAARETQLQSFQLDEHFLPSSPNGQANLLRHIPTWKLPTIPSEHYDLILCNQVLPELTAPSYERVIGHLHRVLKTSGIMFIRDHGLSNMPGHRFHDDAILTSLGYVKEYEPFLVDFGNVHGVPRVYRKSNSGLSPHKCLAQPVENFSLPLPDVFSEGLRLRIEAHGAIATLLWRKLK